jgi:tryptophan synthase alpha chain
MLPPRSNHRGMNFGSVPDPCVFSPTLATSDLDDVSQPHDSLATARPIGVREAMARARAEGRCALVPYLTMGSPDLESSVLVLRTLEQLGVDAVEIGIPFSDPVADGPTIQRTVDRALARGVTLRASLQRLREPDVPPSAATARVLFSYLNPLLAYGLPRLPTAMVAGGIGAAIVTDLVVEEAKDWLALTNAHGIEACFLVASTSSEERLRRAMQHTTGFLYCVSTLGVTGARTALDAGARTLVERVRALDRDLPVAVGFGIRTPEDVREVRRFADGVVVGSALLNALDGARGPEDLVTRTRAFIEPMLEAARH